MRPRNLPAAQLRPTLLLLAVLLPALAAPGAGDGADTGGLTPREQRGKEFYLRGESASGEPVMALMGDAGIEVPATALPCSSCHGRDGRGRPEGGVEPSDLTWDALTRPYTVTTATGRQRGPYDEGLLKRAIVTGLDSSGNELDTVMPRYRLSREDAADLVAYLRRLGDDRDPGVGEDTLTLGVLLPPPGSGLESTAGAVRRVVDGYVERVNGEGGVYHRRLTVRTLPLPEDPAARAAAVESFLDAEPTFALVAPFTAGADRQLAELAEGREIPMIGPLTLHPDESFPLNRQVFYLDSGLAGQGRALVQRAVARLAEAPGDEDEGGGEADGETTAAPGLAVVHPPDELLTALAADLAERAEEGGFARVEQVEIEPAAFDAPALVERLRGAGVEEVLLLAPGGQESALLDAAAAADWAPRVSALGSLAGPDLFTPRPRYRGELYLAFNSLPVDRTPPGLEDFRHDTGLDQPRSATEIAVFLAVDLLVDGLETTGRDLTREGLIESLELLRDKPTGLSRPLSFGPNRRVGVRGAYVVRVEDGEPSGVAWEEGA